VSFRALTREHDFKTLNAGNFNMEPSNYGLRKKNM
jgi:hypothetical protein